MTTGGNAFNVQGNNGYGLEITGNVVLTANRGFGVVNATNSNVNQALTLSGVVSGAFNLEKTGAGTLVLSNTANSFGNAGNSLDVRGGVVSVASDNQLGDPLTAVRLNSTIINLIATTTLNLPVVTITTGSTAGLYPGFSVVLPGVTNPVNVIGAYDAATVVLSTNATADGTGIPLSFFTIPTLRVTGTFGTSRTIILDKANSGIDVTPGNTLTLNTAFSLPTPSNGLTKFNNGTLVVNANNAFWSGPINIISEAIRTSTASSLGSGTISVAPTSATTGAALQLTGGVTISNPLSLQGTGNVLLGGINAGRQLQSVSGNNTYSGLISFANDGAIGADTGSTLNITGGINVAATTNKTLSINANGNINVTSNLGFSGGATGFFAIQKFGAGTGPAPSPSALPRRGWGRTLPMRQALASSPGPCCSTGQGLSPAGFYLYVPSTPPSPSITAARLSPAGSVVARCKSAVGPSTSSAMPQPPPKSPASSPSLPAGRVR